MVCCFLSLHSGQHSVFEHVKVCSTCQMHVLPGCGACNKHCVPTLSRTKQDGMWPATLKLWFNHSTFLHVHDVMQVLGAQCYLQATAAAISGWCRQPQATHRAPLGQAAVLPSAAPMTQAHALALAVLLGTCVTTLARTTSSVKHPTTSRVSICHSMEHQCMPSPIMLE